jgi:nitrogen fixation/metabolism regulation signal transduction histidine kinase
MYLAHVDATRALPAAVRAELGGAEGALLALTAAMSLLMAAALGLFGVLITHRVAGPVYVMSHYVSVLARGRFPLMRPLRKRDELKGFFERFQDAIEALRQREADEAATLEQSLTTLRGLPNSSEVSQVIEAREAMRVRKRDATDRIEVGGQRPAA